MNNITSLQLILNICIKLHGVNPNTNTLNDLWSWYCSFKKSIDKKSFFKCTYYLSIFKNILFQNKFDFIFNQKRPVKFKMHKNKISIVTDAKKTMKKP